MGASVFSPGTDVTNPYFIGCRLSLKEVAGSFGEAIAGRDHIHEVFNA
jgi:hypothetical protein